MDKLPGLSVLSTAIELPFKWHYKGFPFVFSVCVNCCSSLWNLFTSLSGMKRSNLFLFPGTYIDVTDLNLARNYSSSQIHIVNEYLISQGSSKDVCVFFFWCKLSRRFLDENVDHGNISSISLNQTKNHKFLIKARWNYS